MRQYIIIGTRYDSVYIRGYTVCVDILYISALYKQIQCSQYTGATLSLIVVLYYNKRIKRTCRGLKHVSIELLNYRLKPVILQGCSGRARQLCSDACVLT